VGLGAYVVDEIVYGLYNLNEDEIKAAEGENDKQR
jgi:hypothetical protein